MRKCIIFCFMLLGIQWCYLVVIGNTGIGISLLVSGILSSLIGMLIFFLNEKIFHIKYIVFYIFNICINMLLGLLIFFTYKAYATLSSFWIFVFQIKYTSMEFLIPFVIVKGIPVYFICTSLFMFLLNLMKKHGMFTK